jgi:hypothetical protein
MGGKVKCIFICTPRLSHNPSTPLRLDRHYGQYIITQGIQKRFLQNSLQHIILKTFMAPCISAPRLLTTSKQLNCSISQAAAAAAAAWGGIDKKSYSCSIAIDSSQREEALQTAWIPVKRKHWDCVNKKKNCAKMGGPCVGGFDAWWVTK